jgi:hypothetical protein
MKQEHTGCEHGPEYHEEGLCWKITNPELEEEPTDKKYCPCNSNKGLIRRYERTGYMEAQSDDRMIPRPCDSCGAEVLLVIGNKICISCKASI